MLDGRRARLPDVLAGLKRLVDESAVLVHGWGSGFFVAPGKAITCAHVVGAKGRVADRVTLAWQGHAMSGKVTAIPSRNTTGGLWGYPDLALIDVENPPAGHPWVWLDPTPPSHDAELYAVGYSSTYTPEPGLSRAVLTYVGPQQFGTGDLFKVKDDELAPGMSGGPVLDLFQGGVCGIIKTSRKRESPHGGLVIPADAILEHFPELASAAPGGWGELRTALRHASAARELLASDQELQWLSALATLQSNPHALFRLAVGELRPEPEEPLRDGEDLVREVADSVPPAPGEPHPLVRLCEVLAARSGGPESDRLRELAGRVARRVGQESPLDRPDRHVRAGRTRRSSAVEVHLTPYAPNPRRHLLTVWSHGDVGERPAQIFCDDSPLTLRQVRSRLKAVLPGAVAALHDAGDLTIEFTLPHRLIHEGVDEWDLGTKEVPLGSRFPVIIRIGDRPPETGWHWRRRWESLATHDGDHQGVLTWVDCRFERDFRKLYGCFQLEDGLAVLAVSYQPGADILKALVHAGIPVALWPRKICEEHADGARCPGDRFRDAFTTDIAGKPLRDLPLLVKTLRTKAIIDDGHYAGGLTLLWDDPTRERPDEYSALGVPS